jgi:tripartite-type tricarboxylate transporter receptor subunit TctC
VLVTNPKLNVKTISDLIALSKAKPNSLTYASIGDGTPHHLAMELLKNIAKIDPLHIPYRGVGPALNDVVGGQVDLMFTGTSTAKPFIDSGKLVPLAVSSLKRQSVFPNVPTIAESGVKGYDFVTWYGIVAPAKTPAEITNMLSKEIATALSHQDVKERLASLGVVPVSSTPEEFASFLGREAIRFERIIKDTGVKLQ